MSWQNFSSKSKQVQSGAIKGGGGWNNFAKKTAKPAAPTPPPVYTPAPITPQQTFQANLNAMGSNLAAAGSKIKSFITGQPSEVPQFSEPLMRAIQNVPQQQTKSQFQLDMGTPTAAASSTIDESKRRSKEGRKLDVWDKIEEIQNNPVKLVPFVSSVDDIGKLYELNQAATRLRQGKSTVSDELLLKEYYKRSQQDTSFGYKVLDVATQAVPFAAELYLTAGIATAGRVGATKGLKYLLTKAGKEVLEKDMEKLGFKLATGVVARTLQTPVAGATRIAANTLEKQVQSTLTAEDLSEKESLLKSATKAFGEQWVETLSEFSGGIFSAKYLPKSVTNKIIKSSLFKLVKKLNPAAMSPQIQEIFDIVGYNGVLGEMFEERIGEVSNAVLEKVGLSDQKFKLPTADQLLVELVAFSIPSIGGLALTKAMNYGKVEMPPATSVDMPTGGSVEEDKLPEIKKQAQQYKNADDFASELGTTAQKQIGTMNPNDIVARDEVDTNSTEYKTLVADIKQNGITEPVIVQVENGKIETTDGSHRVTAAKEAGVEVPVIVTKGSIDGLKTILDFYNAAKQTKITEKKVEIPGKEAVESPKTVEEKKTEVETVKKESSWDNVKDWGELNEATPEMIQKAEELGKASVAKGFIQLKQDEELGKLIAKVGYNRQDKLLEAYNKAYKNEKNKDFRRNQHIERLEKSLAKWKETGLDKDIPEEYKRYQQILKDLKAGKDYKESDVTEETLKEVSSQIPRVNQNFKGENIPYKGDKKPKKEEKPPKEEPKKEEEKSEAKKLTKEEQIAKASELGKKAFESGKKSTPAQDKEFMDFIESQNLQVGESIPLLSAWNDAWHKANMAESVEKIEPTIEKPKVFIPGDRVSFQDEGQTLTGTVRSYNEKDFYAMVDVDQIAIVGGGIPIGRVSMVSYSRLTLIEPQKSIIEPNETSTIQSKRLPDSGEVRQPTDRGRNPEVDERTLHDETTGVSESGAGLERIGTVGRAKLNAEAEAILNKHDFSTVATDYSEKELETLRLYSGAGGKEAAGASGKGLLSEYYTPPEVTQKVWSLVNQLAPNAEKMLEPSIGTGALLDGKPENILVNSYEYQQVSGTIAKILNQKITVNIGNGKEFNNPGNFETNQARDFYDIVVGNPPFGERASFLKGKGEEPKINRWEEYFIKKGLDSLANDGILVYVVNSSFLNKESSYAKEEIAKLGELVAAYRLPEGIFADTSIGTDIVVFRKKRAVTDYAERINNLVSGNYFAKNPDNVAGTTETRTNRFGKEETYTKGTLDDVKRLNMIVEQPETVEVAPPVVSNKPVNDKYFVVERTPGNEIVFTEVKGEAVDIGLEDAFVHKMGNKTPGNRENWRVTEAKTGKLIVSGTTKADVIEKARETIKRVGAERVKEATDKALKDTGLSPRYTQKEVEKKKLTTESYTAKVVKRINKQAKEGKLPPVIVPDKKAVAVIPTQTVMGSAIQPDMVELAILKNTEVDGSVKRTGKQEDKYLNYYQGKYYHDINYFSGDIYQKLEDLEQDKAAIIEKMGKEQYDKQLKGLERVKPAPVKLDDITFDPLDRYVANIQVTPAEGRNQEMKVSDQFISFLNRTDSALSYGVDRWDVRNYVMGFRMSKGKKNVMGKIKADANRLFNYFIRNVLSEDIQAEIVSKFNREKNSYVNPDYSKVPTEIKNMAKYFRGKTFKLSETQSNGVSFLTNKGVGLVAYGVGVGKTHTLLTATMVAHQRGWNKRPVFIVPKSTLTKTWIGTIRAMFPGQTIVNLGGLTKPDVTKIEAMRGKDKKKWIKDGEISVLTHEGLLRLALTPEEMESAIGDLNDALQTESKTERQAQAKEGKIQEIVGKAQYKAGDINISDLGFDHISVDEVHNFRKIFQGAKPETLNPDGTVDKTVTKRFGNVIGGTPSKQAQQLFLISQYILKKNNNRGVYLASATPFENHATEVYNILSLVARDRLKTMGIFNINDFFALFSNFETELEKNVQGEWVNKEKMKSFKNLPQLQKLLREFVDYQVDPTLVRPERRVITPHLQMSQLQEENLAKIQEMLKPSDGRKPEDGAVLKASTYSVANSISPYFIKEWQPEIVTPEELIANSPKLQYSMELVKQLKADKKTNKYGTFLYIGANGVEYHNHILDYAVRKLGFKPVEVAVINGATPNEEREAIKEQFQDGTIKLLIGGDPTKEGIDLQNNGYTTINVALGWNPTEVAQVEGRVWRQGNKRNIAPLVYPLVENSGDITVYNKFEEKGGRINDLFSYQGQIFDVGELDPREKKLALMTRPEDKAAIEIEIDKAEAQNELMIVSTDISNMKRIQERLVSVDRDITSTQERVTTKKTSWGSEMSEEQVEEYRKELAKLKREKKSLEDYLERKSITDIPAKIAELESMQTTINNKIKDITNTYEGRLEKFRAEYNDMIANRKTIQDHIVEFGEKTKDLRELSDEELEAKRERLIDELQAMRSPSIPKGADASMGAESIGNFEDRTGEPTKADFKLHEEVLKLVKKYAKRIGEGYLPKGTAGVFYQDTENIRVRGMNDLSTGLHEISHRLDSKYKISERLRKTVGETIDGKPIYDPTTRKIRKEITELYVGYYPGGKKTHSLKKRVREGLATLIQKYAEQPTIVSQEYPNLVKQFLTEEGEYYEPVIGEILADVSQIIETYQGLDPLDKIGARVTSDNVVYDRKSFMSLGDQIRTQLADTIFPIEKLARITGKDMSEADPSLYIRQYLQVNGIVANNLIGKKGYFRYKSGEGFQKTLDYNWKTLVDSLEKSKTSDSFGYYLVARASYYDYQQLKEYKKAYNELRQQVADVGVDEAAQMMGKNGKTLLEEYKEAKKLYIDQQVMLEKDGITEREATAAYEQNKERFAADEKMFDALVAEDLKLLNEEDVGILGDKQYKELSSRKGYASRKRQMFDEIVGEETVPSQLKVGKTTISSLLSRKGSSRTILNPIYSGIRNHSEIIKKSYKQVVYNKLNALAAQLPELAQPQKLIRARQSNGVFHYPQDRDPNIIMGRKDGKRMPVLWDNYVKTTIEELITPNNYGVFEQLLLGVSRGFTKGTTGLYPAFALTNWVGDQITATANTTNEYVPLSSTFHQLTKALLQHDSPEAKYYLEYLVLGGERQTFVGWQDLSAEELSKKIRDERNGILKVVDGINAGLDILALPSKYSELTTRATEYIKSRKSGKPQIVSLEEAGRVTAPFHHVGKWGGQFGKTAIKSIPFFNPAIQVLDQMIRTGQTKKGRVRLAAVTSAITAAAIGAFALLMANGTDDQKRLYRDLEANELVDYIWLPSPDGKTLIKIKVQQYGIAGNLINMALANMMLDANYGVGDFISGAAQILPQQFNITEPVRAMLSWIPPLIKVPLMTALNVKDYPRILPLENQYLQSLPPGLRANEGTSWLAKEIGKRTGLSPVKLDYLVTGLLGRSVGFITGKTSVYNPLSGVTRAEYWTSGRTIQNYYDIKNKNDQMYKAVKDKTMTVSDKEKNKILRIHQVGLETEKYLKLYRDIDVEKYPDRANKLRNEIVRRIQMIQKIESEGKKISLMPQAYAADNMVAFSGTPHQEAAYQKLSNWTTGEASYYNPKNPAETRPGANGIGAYGRAIESGSVAFGNRVFQDKLKAGEEIYIQVKGFENVQTPYGNGIFRIDDTMNPRYNKQGQFNIDFHPGDISPEQKKKGRYKIEFRIVDPNTKEPEKPNYEKEYNFLKRYYA